MKRILVFSVVVNLLLLGALIWVRRSVPPPREASTSTASGSVAGRPAASRGAELTWASLPDDPTAMAERLKAAGMPNDVMRALVGVRLEQRRTARRLELEKEAPLQPFWRAVMPASWLQARSEAQLELNEMEIADDRLLTSLFGAPSVTTLDKLEDRYYSRFRYGDLPLEKQQRLLAIERDYDEQTRGQSVIAAGLVGPVDSQAYALLKSEKEKDIRAVLTPEEYEVYELRGSYTADTMRAWMGDFRPTEQEFLAIFRLQKAFDEAYPPDLPRLRGDLEPRTQAEFQLKARLAEALGAARAEEYHRESNFFFRRLLRAGKELEVPRENVVQVWNTQQEIHGRANALLASGGVAANQEQLRALQKEAAERIAAAAGAKGERLLNANGPLRQWLSGLAP